MGPAWQDFRFTLDGHETPGCGSCEGDHMINDLRHAVRFLLRNPGFTLSAVTVLSLGIGLNVTAALVWITGRPAGSEPAPENLTYPDLVDLGRDPTMSGVTGFAPARLAISAGARSARVAGEIVPGNYFQVLGITTAVRRPPGCPRRRRDHRRCALAAALRPAPRCDRAGGGDQW